MLYLLIDHDGVSFPVFSIQFSLLFSFVFCCSVVSIQLCLLGSSLEDIKLCLFPCGMQILLIIGLLNINEVFYRLQHQGSMHIAKDAISFNPIPQCEHYLSVVKVLALPIYAFPYLTGG